ncbi:DUF2971 domain-containing protein [Microbacterium thalassium]|uniref:DUF2971 domain-containing protein n=1 Tax=Microbacterium thalassium TaxID=362649 RepID=A0A7X0KTC6_9MICO|nr:DUF2971 domain-containing protein [Microbacterium thalassium]MBB6389986.1 hypothetical protein [Microbacterium thalassium]
MTDDETYALPGTALIVPPLSEHHDGVWHYTDAHGLAGIVGGGPSGWPEKIGVLWATAATMLNDPDELEYGVARVVEWFEQQDYLDEGTAGAHIVIRSVLSGLREWILANPAYVVCASTEGDMLGQWRGYAGTAGYAIKLDPAHEWAVWARDGQAGFAWSPSWVKVAYTAHEQDALMRRYFSYLLSEDNFIGRLVAEFAIQDAVEHVRAMLSGLATALKDPSFAAEQEVRLIAFPPDGVSPRFRGSVRGLVPYLELVPAVFPHMLRPHKPIALPVQDITVGPPRGDQMNQRARTARILLDSTGRKAVPVNRSVIPFIP